MQKVKKELNKILDLLEAIQMELDGSALIDEIENSVVVLAKKYGIKL